MTDTSTTQTAPDRVTTLQSALAVVHAAAADGSHAALSGSECLALRQYLDRLQNAVLGVADDRDPWWGRIADVATEIRQLESETRR